MATDYRLLGAELLPSQIDVDAAAEPVPIMVPGPLALHVDLGEHSLTSPSDSPTAAEFEYEHGRESHGRKVQI